jgi:hypothetical protein
LGLFALSTPFNQFPNKLLIFFGGEILKDIYTMWHNIFARGHSKNKC